VNRPLVSVVVPVYNGERFLASALCSVFEQDYRPFEVIVVDDGSTDGTAGIARSFRRVRYVYQKNQGPAAARNTGVATARAEYIAFLDADDIWTPKKLSVQMEHLLDHPEVGYVSARARNFLESTADLPAWLTEELFTKEHPALPSALVVRKPVFYEIGEFDPGYAVAEDVDWLARAKAAEVQSFLVPETLVHRRIHDSNLSSQTRLNREAILKIARKSMRRRGRRMESG
jgi:glycosyltransferase involved in cell wall biosynthesis